MQDDTEHRRFESSSQRSYIKMVKRRSTKGGKAEDEDEPRYRDAVDPDRLRKGARVAKANLGRLEKRVSEATHLDEGSVETLLEQLEAAWCAFAEVQDEILLFDDNQFNFDQEFEIRGEYEDRYIAIKSNLKEKLLNHRGRSSSHDVSSSSVSHSAKPDLKLPKIELPEFSGNYT